jgi:hypothetical protein
MYEVHIDLSEVLSTMLSYLPGQISKLLYAAFKSHPQISIFSPESKPHSYDINHHQRASHPRGNSATMHFNHPVANLQLANFVC